MSVLRLVSLLCDGGDKGCAVDYPTRLVTYLAAREEAQRAGWRTRDVVNRRGFPEDHCPACARARGLA